MMSKVRMSNVAWCVFRYCAPGLRLLGRVISDTAFCRQTYRQHNFRYWCTQIDRASEWKGEEGIKIIAIPDTRICRPCGVRGLNFSPICTYLYTFDDSILHVTLLSWNTIAAFTWPLHYHFYFLATWNCNIVWNNNFWRKVLHVQRVHDSVKGNKMQW